MKFFSNSIGRYAGQMKWGILALFGVGFLRFLMAPIGVPIAIGDMATSITIVLLICVLAYAVYHGRSGGKLGDVVVATVVLVLAYTATIAVFLSLSVGLGLDTYFTDPRHFRGNAEGHILAHLRAMPITALIGSVLGVVVF